ncbi:hypothetical protein Afil01_42290 [Actinorhabdospora filicis]|uniref:HTH luxR-type domain-containing protein n=1 Tax=Actinorhabdospora filicis TaxID=1785913 RepID=A0A9W6SP02_9ACTN|nr:AAA family ATPase [Actinorhabdospora filicis]GLZ79422.1 hypothetical protein Afil01_42290 [Actinorhabdospora filicis]
MVGRDRQLAAVTGAWTRVRATGAGHAVVITGDPGTGKTALVESALDAARPATVLRGRARTIGPAPYDWLASALDGHDLDGLPASPQALAWLTQRPSGQRVAPGTLLRAAVDVVRHRVGDGPGVLVVEDLHDLDPASLDLVAELATADNLPALILITSRPPKGHASKVLARLSAATRCHLGPLTPADTAELLGATREYTPETVMRVHHRTGGNPRWLSELMTAVDSGELASPTAPLPAYLAALAAEEGGEAPIVAEARGDRPGQKSPKAAALDAFARGHYTRALAAVRRWHDATTGAERVEALRVRADLCVHHGRADVQHRLLEAIAPRVPPQGRVAYLTSLGLAALAAERPAEAVGWAEQALDLAPEPEPDALTVLGRATPDPERGAALLSAARRYAAARRDPIAFGRAVVALAVVRASGKDAHRVLEEAAATLDRHGLTARGGPLVTAAVLASLTEDPLAAEERATARLPIETDPAERALLTAIAGRLAFARGDHDKAARMRERLAGSTMDQPRVRREAQALDGLFADPLTAREREVVRCLTEGLTNQQIATRLGISVRTVTVHVSNLLRKTGTASRTEAALWAVHQGLHT